MGIPDLSSNQTYLEGTIMNDSIPATVSEAQYRLHLTWHQVESLVDNIKVDLDHVKTITAVSRGGLIPAAILAHRHGIRVVELIHARSYDDSNKRGELFVHYQPLVLSEPTLIIDDICDSGNTFRAIKTHVTGQVYTMAALVAKDGCGMLEEFQYGVEVPSNIWVVFPWE